MGTYGEKLAGVDFNPSKAPEVDRAKKLCAELIDMCHTASIALEGRPRSMQGYLYECAIEKLLIAQMMVVKAQTWRHDDASAVAPG